MFCSLNGVITPYAQAQIDINDLGLLRGYGIFDYFRIHQNTPLFLEDHLDRFYKSAEIIKLAIPFEREELTTGIFELIRLNNMSQSGIRLVLTGGYSENAYSIGKPNLIITQEPFSFSSDSVYREGVKLITHEYMREIPEVKTTNYITAIWQQDQIASANAFDVLYHQKGLISEVSRSNFFLITQNNKLITPVSGILKGVTRKNVLSLARKRYEVEERAVSISELKTASEAFLTGTTKKILPVVRADGTVIGKGIPGEMTLQLSADFEKFETDHFDKHR